MPAERTSPSDGWRAVYHEMDVSTAADVTVASCPVCGIDTVRVGSNTVLCPTHGTGRATPG